jgi:glycosyltransferase involved in cell wall biosynthesis
MALGRAIIGANIGGIPELVQEGETGMLFEPGNNNELSEKIGFLLANPYLQTEWGRNARDRVEKEFKPEKFYQLTMEIYTRLVELNGNRAQP